jgi:hypothetical protein
MAPLLGQRIDLMLMPCAEFFDFETKLALVEKDLNAQRGQHEFTFRYSGKDCKGYFWP